MPFGYGVDFRTSTSPKPRSTNTLGSIISLLISDVHAIDSKSMENSRRPVLDVVESFVDFGFEGVRFGNDCFESGSVVITFEYEMSD